MKHLRDYFEEQLHECRVHLLFGKYFTTEHGYLEVSFSIPNSPARGIFIVASEKEVVDCIRYGMRNQLFSALTPFKEPERNFAAVLFAFGIEAEDPSALSWQTPDQEFEVFVEGFYAEKNFCKIRKGQQTLSVYDNGVYHCLRDWRRYLFENFDLEGDHFVKKQDDLLGFRPMPQMIHLNEDDPVEAYHHPVFKQHL